MRSIRSAGKSVLLDAVALARDTGALILTAATIAAAALRRALSDNGKDKKQE